VACAGDLTFVHDDEGEARRVRVKFGDTNTTRFDFLRVAFTSRYFFREFRDILREHIWSGFGSVEAAEAQMCRIDAAHFREKVQHLSIYATTGAVLTDLTPDSLKFNMRLASPHDIGVPVLEATNREQKAAVRAVKAHRKDVTVIFQDEFRQIREVSLENEMVGSMVVGSEGEEDEEDSV
jgi:hypothetical protein